MPMSAGTQHCEYDGLLPERVKARLVTLCVRSSGALLLALTAFVCLSLVTWSVKGSALTQTAGDSTGNATGAVGNILSELLLQMLGLGSVVCLLSPMIWGIQLIYGEGVNSFRIKAILYPASNLLLAGALSSLPVAPAWPLHHAMGGKLGDLSIDIAQTALSTATGSRSTTFLAGIALFATGFGALAFSIGGDLWNIMTIARFRLLGGSTADPVTPQIKALARQRPSSTSPPHRSGGESKTNDEAVAGSWEANDEDNLTGFYSCRSIAVRFGPNACRGPAAPDIETPLPGSDAPHVAPSATAQQLLDALANYGVKGEILDVKRGPVVTLFEFEPVRGTNSARVMSLAGDIARSIGVMSLRVVILPGGNIVGLELPNDKREPILLREILESESFRSTKALLPLALGKSIGGDAIIADLARMPQLLVAGTTGSGKSVGVNAMILSLLSRHTPDECLFILIDPKMTNLSVYNGIPHLLMPVVTDPHKAVAVLNWAVTEMEERYKCMAALSVHNLEAFNLRVNEATERGEALMRRVQTGFDRATGQPRFVMQKIDVHKLPFIVVVIDEFADLMVVAGKEIEQAVQRLARMSRAAGIHLIMATGRPSFDIITGTIKANFSTRISFKATSKIDSRTILDEQGAEQLLDQGDMLFSMGAGPITRVHSPFVSDDVIEAALDFAKAHGEPKGTTSRQF